jgi:hypothetical protein
MSKSFTQAPKPKPLTVEVIRAFEREGTGQDNSKPVVAPENTHIPSNVGNGDTTKVVNKEPTSRMSIDIAESLHIRFKVACAKKKKKMQNEIAKFIERRTSELEKD